MRYKNILLILLLCITACANQKENKETTKVSESPLEDTAGSIELNKDDIKYLSEKASEAFKNYDIDDPAWAESDWHVVIEQNDANEYDILYICTFFGGDVYKFYRVFFGWDGNHNSEPTISGILYQEIVNGPTIRLGEE